MATHSTHTIQLKANSLDQILETDTPLFTGAGITSEAGDYLYTEADVVQLNVPLALDISVPKKDMQEGLTARLEEILRNYCSYQAILGERELKLTFKRGRRNLLVAILFIAACFLIAYLLGQRASDDVKLLINGVFAIASWVALWTPIETFLFDWWPIARQAKMYRRLAKASIKISAY